MRRYQKQLLTEKIHIICEAHACIERLMLEEQDITELLTDCQGAAIEIGTFIEETEGEGTRTVVLLEDYCEHLYEISQRRFPMNPSQMAAAVRAELEEHINLIQKSLKEDIEEQRVVIFFPYKAAMWDSMETVWRRLCEEKNTTCHVVVVPYYTKDSDRKKVKMHYEGADFPADVPVVSYEEFLAKEEYADIAVYHNPYDDTNRITEVDERFFSTRLRRYAQTLVYIPYYVLVDKELPAAFALTPGVKNADYVIVDNEEVARQYRHWYPKQPDKFLPLGSPKIEKAVQMNGIPREQLDITQEWKDRIRGKKVLFYNTHLVNFFDESRDFIGKLNEVFDIIQKQNEVVLWWRPHPLSEDMENLTGSERFREYEELVRRYKEENIGIYDDTPGLHEAVAAADAYYGDGSSVVKLFEAVGKPVMLQSEKLAHRCEVIFEMGCQRRDKIWYSCELHNAVYYQNKGEDKFHYVTHIPDEDMKQHNLYGKIYCWKDKLIFLPFAAKKLAVYDPEKDEFRKYEIAQDNKNGFFTAEIYNNQLYMLPNYTNEFYKLDLNTMNVKKVQKLTECVEKKRAKSGITMQSCMIGSSIYFVLQETNILCEYDVNLDLCYMHNLPESMLYAEVLVIGEELYVMALDKPCLLHFEKETNTWAEYMFDDVLAEWGDVIRYGDFYNDGNYIVFEVEDLDLEIEFQIKEKCWKKRNTTLGGVRNNKRIHKYVWDSENGKRLNCFDEDETIRELIRNDYVQETVLVTLEEFVKRLCKES